jgi:large conductance mechanosensitive channel
MHRLREMLAHGGIALLAVVFALAAATVSLANALAQQVVSAIEQSLYDPDTFTGGLLRFTVFGTNVDYALVLQAGIVVVLIGGALFGLWRLTRDALRPCPECRSEVPREATVCRYCTTELPAEG